MKITFKINIIMDSENFDEAHLYKIVIIGDTGTGKTNIITKYVLNHFEMVSRPTIGVEFFQKDLEIKGTNDMPDLLRLQIWDTAGQERFRGMASSYYRKAFGVILVYDITSMLSFNNLDRWFDEVHSYADQNIELVLVGNKTDLADQRQVTLNEGMEFSKKNNLLFYETSALYNNDNKIDEMFKQLATRIHENDRLRAIRESSIAESKKKARNLKEITNQKKVNRRCC